MCNSDFKSGQKYSNKLCDVNWLFLYCRGSLYCNHNSYCTYCTLHNKSK